MSVTFAPRARIAVKAAWPGVSRKVMRVPFVIDRVGADVLRDAAGFARRDARLADRVHQRRLAVIDVAHESDDRRRAVLSSSSFSMTGGGGATTTCSTLVNAAAFFAAFHFENEAVLLANLRRDFRLDRLVRIRENVEVIHQLLDELEIFHAELRRPDP